MADLDTAAKRGAHLHLQRVFDPYLPIPDGTISQGDRQHLAWLYSGILAAGATAGKSWYYFLNQVLIDND